MPSLTNAHLSFELNPPDGGWSLYPRAGDAPALADLRVGAEYDAYLDDRASQPRRWRGGLMDLQVGPTEVRESPHGRLTVLAARSCSPAATDGEPGLIWTLEFALPETRPFFLWRVGVRNEGAAPVVLNMVHLAAVGKHFANLRRGGLFSWGLDPGALLGGAPPGAVRLHASPGRLAFYSDGYQSWSYAGTLQAHMRQPGTILGRLIAPLRLNLVTPIARRFGHFTGEMFGVLGDRDGGLGVLAGFIAQQEQFGAMEVFLHGGTPSFRLSAQCDGVRLAPGEQRLTDWAYLQFVDLAAHDPLAEYVEAAGRENQARVPEHTPVGWCSWYHYFNRVTENDILRNLDAISRARRRLPLEFVQLDDGYQAQVGDWFETNRTFPRGLAWLAEQIRARGQTPGVWLAPYIVRSDARLLHAHPDWFIREPSGKLASAGFNWLKWCYGLDPTHPAVREHIRRLIATAVREWGFPYLKLDFLYAAALPGQRHDPSLTRAQAMRLALEDIRAAAGPDTFLLGCGCPLGSAIGLVDGMRISTDVAPNWAPEVVSQFLSGLLRHEMDFVAVRNAIRNTLNRAALHRRWWLNDPDCLLVREHDTKLTEAEVRSLATVIALSGGMFLLSDDMTRLNSDRLRYVRPLMPVLGDGARPKGWMETDMPDVFVLPLARPWGEWVVAGIFNWQDRPRSREVEVAALGLSPAAEYFVSDFWAGRHRRLAPGQPLSFPRLAPHDARLVALRRVTAAPTLVASSFHFSQGGEVDRWDVTPNGLRFTLRLDRMDEGEVRLWLPAAPRAVLVDGQPASAEALGDGLFSVRLAVDGAATVSADW